MMLEVFYYPFIVTHNGLRRDGGRSHFWKGQLTSGQEKLFLACFLLLKSFHGPLGRNSVWLVLWTKAQPRILFIGTYKMKTLSLVLFQYAFPSLPPPSPSLFLVQL